MHEPNDELCAECIMEDRDNAYEQVDKLQGDLDSAHALWLRLRAHELVGYRLVRQYGESCLTCGTQSQAVVVSLGPLLDEHPNPGPDTCGLCKRAATGFASIGDTRYCHGDGDTEPTCYEVVQWRRAQPSDLDWFLTPRAPFDFWAAKQATTSSDGTRIGPESWTNSSDVDDMCPNCVTPWKCNGPHSTHRDAPGDIGYEGPLPPLFNLRENARDFWRDLRRLFGSSK